MGLYSRLKQKDISGSYSSLINPAPSLLRIDNSIARIQACLK